MDKRSTLFYAAVLECKERLHFLHSFFMFYFCLWKLPLGEYWDLKCHVFPKVKKSAVYFSAFCVYTCSDDLGEFSLACSPGRKTFLEIPEQTSSGPWMLSPWWAEFAVLILCSKEVLVHTSQSALQTPSVCLETDCSTAWAVLICCPRLLRVSLSPCTPCRIVRRPFSAP